MTQDQQPVTGRFRLSVLSASSVSRLRDEVVQNPDLALKQLDGYIPMIYIVKRRELQTAHDEQERLGTAAVQP